MPPRDPRALAGAIEGVLSLPAEERARMGAEGRRFVLEHASLERETAKLSELIAAEAGEDRRRPG